ncbi:uncharacterized protein LOC116179150 [Photinus pyralis]|uniref:uncharacterized protein LOC116179150 n=1 Tax=Photinus pyralis TaxID=7054 RepID=UPI00126760BC|nr:uncharacterized protein LOC116179150 [Photinus pyralis]
MNYEGKVTAVNTTTWTFQLDHKLIIYMGLAASQSREVLLPEIGERIKIYNAHYVINKALSLEALFLCKRSRITSNYGHTFTSESELLASIRRHKLGCADVKAVVENLEIITSRLSDFTSNSPEQVMCNVVDVIASDKAVKNRHTCLNTILAPFALKTISDYRFIDADPDKPKKSPPWSFGAHSKRKEYDKLVGYLKINKRYGIILLHDAQHCVPCVITNRNHVDLYDLTNRLVVIVEFRVFTETFREADVHNVEYILFDVADTFVLKKVSTNDVETVRDILLKEVREDIPYVYSFKFKLHRKGTVNVNRSEQIECWLEVFVPERNEDLYLGLNAHQVQLVPLLVTGETYQVYHSEKLISQNRIELARLKQLDARKFQEKTAIFVKLSRETADSALTVSETVEKLKCSNDLISFIGTLHLKTFVPPLSSRTKAPIVGSSQFGTPGSYTHTLTFQEDESQLVLYLNNWESLRMPFGLVPGMRMCVKNVLPQSRKYLKSTALTRFDILSYEAPVLFDTVNLCKDVQACDKYSYIGWGNLIPASVLIWARITTIYIRSLKIVSKCEVAECSCGDDTCIDVTITFYAHDEMGAALVISKSLELLRLLLGLELSQWKTWCAAFKMVKRYTYNDCDELVSDDVERKLFCDTLNLIVQTVRSGY